MGNCNGKSEPSSRTPLASSTREAENIAVEDIDDMKTDQNDNLVCSCYVNAPKIMTSASQYLDVVEFATFQ